jgi:hypothetical protein
MQQQQQQPQTSAPPDITEVVDELRAEIASTRAALLQFKESQPRINS